MTEKARAYRRKPLPAQFDKRRQCLCAFNVHYNGKGSYNSRHKRQIGFWSLGTDFLSGTGRAEKKAFWLRLLESK